MPKYKRIFRKGDKWYGAKWCGGKTYVTALYPTADEAARARELLAASLRKNRPPENRGKITVAESIRIYLEDLSLRAAAPNEP